jgi:GDP-L-fucose synthase
MNLNSKIYVAGHTGFVGKALTKKLQSMSYKIITAGRKQLNLLDKEQVNKFFMENDIEYVFICAAVVGGIKANMENPYKFLYENLQLQNNLIDACANYGVKKTLFLGSSCIYPSNYIQPLKEDYLLKAPVEPTNEGYALAKICGLKMCEYINRSDNGEHRFLSLMPCNLYGPGDNFDPNNSHVLSALVKKFVDAKVQNKPRVEIWGSGGARREFLYIDDLIDGMIWSFKNVNSNSFLNIGTGKDISIRRLATTIAGFVDYEGKIIYDKSKPDGMLEKCLDVSVIKDFGWEAKTKFEDGLVQTIDYYKKLQENL